MSEPKELCQFNIRKLCPREEQECEFKHALPVRSESSKGNENIEKQEKSAESKDSDNDKETPETEEVPVAKKVNDIELQTHLSEGFQTSNLFLQSMPPPPADANATTNDTSTFIASTTIGEAPQNNQQMARRVVKTGGAEDEGSAAKEIRRDSKGFENFDDYFESDANDSTMTTGEKTNDDESLQEAEQQEQESEPKEPNAFTTSVPAPTETMPEEILDGDKTANKNKKSNLEDLSKEWDDEDITEEQPAKETSEKAPESVADEKVQEAPADTNTEAVSEDVEMQEAPEASTEKEPTEKQTFVVEAPQEQEQQQQEPAPSTTEEASEAPAANEDETIENIENFLVAEKSSSEKPTTTKPKTQPKEEWVTVIFGEDGKQIPDKSGGKTMQEKSVYDLDDEDFSATKATPFAGNRKKSLNKAEGVTKIGNNTYYYTGEKPDEGAQEDASTAGEEEEDDNAENAGLITSDPYGGFEDSQDNEDIASTQGILFLTLHSAVSATGETIMPEETPFGPLAKLGV